MKVLIVDDSQVVRDRLGAMLSDLGRVEVDAAERTKQAIAALEQPLPEAIILDLILPDGPSFPLIRHIKSIDPGITVIVLTNYAFTSYRQQCLQYGADYFFDKSSEFGKAVELIERMAEEAVN